MRSLTFVLLTAVACVYGKRFRCDYQYFPAANSWVKYHAVPATWRDARLRCHLEGATLASPLTEELKTALWGHTPADGCGVFTGIHATFSPGDYFSVEGVPLWKIPHKWARQEPNNYKNEESCLLMTLEGELADVSCGDTYPYLCYKKNSSVGVMTGCGTTDNGYSMDTRTGSCYKFHREPRTWARAYMTCAAEGGYLAIINSETEAQVIRDIFTKHPAKELAGAVDKDLALIGFKDWDGSREFLTIEGQSLEGAGYAKFRDGEPNNYQSDEYCGCVYRSGLLNDVSCENKYPFLCEKSPDSLLCDDDQ